MLACIPPGVNFALVGVDGRLFFVYFPANRKALCFPPAYGALVPFQISGNFLPGIEARVRSFGGANLWLGFAGAHERTLRGAEYLGIVAHGTAKSNSQLEGPRSG